MLRFLKYLIEFVAAFVGFIILLAVLLAWRLSASPITSDFMTPYIETGIESLVPGSVVHAAGTLLTWDNVEHMVSLHADAIKVSDADGAEIADIPSLDAKISLIGLLFGQFLPRDLIIDHPQIKLERNKDDVFFFGGLAMGSNAETAQRPSRPIKEVLGNISDHLSHAALMHKLAVTRAVFDVHDVVTQKDWAISVPEISITRTGLVALDHGLEFGALDGRVTIEVTQKEATAKLDVHYLYDPQKTRHSLSTVFRDLTPAFIAGGHPETLGLGIASAADLPLSGKIEATLDKTWTIETATVELHGEEGHLTYADFWDAPFPIASLDMHADYDRDTQKLTLSDTRIDLGGPVLTLDVMGNASSQNGKDMDFTANVQVANLPMNSFGAVWPKPIVPDAREWLSANLREGTFARADATIKGALAWNDLANLAINEGGGKISAVGARVTYLDGMPPVAGVNAEAVFDLKKLSAHITAGGIGAIHLLPMTVDITGLADVDQYIHIPLQVAGPVPDILALLDHPPLGYAKKLGIMPADLQGNIQGTVDFKFPLLKSLEMKNVALNATANATGVASTKLVPGLAIDQGTIALTLDMSGFTLKGLANLDKIPFQIAWQQNFEATAGKPLQQATLTGTIRDDQWAGLGITAFAGTKGPINLSFQITRPTKTKTQFTGNVDMTPAAVQVDMMGWKKPANSPASLKFTGVAVAGRPIAFSSISLRGDHVSATGSAVMSEDMSQLLSLNLSPLVIGRTNAALQFNQALGAEGALHFNVSGKSLDVSGLRGGKDPERNDPRPKEYKINVEQLFTSAFGVVTAAHGFASRDAVGWSAIELEGIVGGGKSLSIKLVPQPDGHRTLAIACDDFGEAMKGLGFTDAIKGGKVSVTGQSTVAAPRLIIGSAKINDFTVVNLPVLALLINATSPFGFGNILTDSADFSRFEGDFRWEGDALILTRAHAAGSAMGINVDGKIDMNTSEANLQGTLVPFSVMNNVLNYIPVIGGLITGGDNQGVLAVAYNISGPLGSPRIGVNPISLLTPGFLRNLFFRDDAADDKNQP